MLSIIIGCSDLSLGLIAPENPVNHYVSQTKKAAERAALLTKQLLAFGRKQVVFPRLLDLNEVARNATEIFLRLVGEDVSVEFCPTTPLGSINADSGQVEQALMNLVVNARDAMPTGGRIIIETGPSELHESYVSQHRDAHVGPYVFWRSAIRVAEWMNSSKLKSSSLSSPLRRSGAELVWGSRPCTES